jgi:hypothetical protein
MKRLLVVAALSAALAWPIASSSVGQHFGGRPGGGRPAPQPAMRPVTPSFQRPVPQAALPRYVPQSFVAHPGVVPSAPGAARPMVSAPRPAAGLYRPNVPTGPAIQRPGVADRPAVNRPMVVNRPNVNRSNTVNAINVNRWDQSHRQGSDHRPWWDRPANWNRSWYAGRPAWYWGRPYYWQHWPWHHGYWNYWATLPPLWFGSGLATGWLLSPGDTFVYYNPYYTTADVVAQYLDYSTPLPAPSADEVADAYPPDPDQADDGSATFATTAAPTPQTDDPAVRAADEALDQARAAFKRNDYTLAQALVERAIALLPSDPALHEFRALTLFAQGKYRETAATLYAVLATGPGWDWPTMASCYPDVDTYTRQLRALEDYVRQHADDAAVRFVLAYHYLVGGHKDAAIAQLREVVRLKPEDKLSAALLQALTSTDAAGSVAAPPSPGGGR